jgi:hypothetical protein
MAEIPSWGTMIKGLKCLQTHAIAWFQPLLKKTKMIQTPTFSLLFTTFMLPKAALK